MVQIYKMPIFLKIMFQLNIVPNCLVPKWRFANFSTGKNNGKHVLWKMFLKPFRCSRIFKGMSFVIILHFPNKLGQSFVFENGFSGIIVEGAAHAPVCGKGCEDCWTADHLILPLAPLQDPTFPTLGATHSNGIKAWQLGPPKSRNYCRERIRKVSSIKDFLKVLTIII